MITPSSTNGKSPTNGSLPNEEIIFPVTFELKAVFDAPYEDSENKQQLKALFTRLKVKNSFVRKKLSSKGTYVSYSYQVTIGDKPLLEQLYAELKQVPGLKTAI